MYDSHDQFLDAARLLCNAIKTGDDPELADVLAARVNAWVADPSAATTDELARILNPISFRYPTARHLLDYATHGPASERAPIGQIEGRDVYDITIMRVYVEDDEMRIFYRADVEPEPIEKQPIYGVLEIPFEELSLPAALAGFQDACRNEVMLRRFGRFGSSAKAHLPSYVAETSRYLLQKVTAELRGTAWSWRRPRPDHVSEHGFYWMATRKHYNRSWRLTIILVDERGIFEIGKRRPITLSVAEARFQRLTTPALPEAGE